MTGGGITTEIFIEAVAPNHSTPSWTIFQAKAYVPGLEGAVALKVKVAFWPGLIGEDGKPTRPNPQVVLSCGLCEPRLCGVEPPEAQVLVPLLFITTVA